GVAGRPRAGANRGGGPGNPGIAVSGPARGAGLGSTGKRTKVQNEPGTDTPPPHKAPPPPPKITAPRHNSARYSLTNLKKRNPQPTDKPAKPPDAAEIATIETETKKSIQEKVRNLLPDFDKGTNPYPHVVVETYTDLPKPPVAPPTLAQSSTTWLADNWQTLALIGVGLGSLLMLRSMVRSLPQSAASPSAAAHQPAQPRLAVHEPGDEEV